MIQRILLRLNIRSYQTYLLACLLAAADAVYQGNETICAPGPYHLLLSPPILLISPFPSLFLHEILGFIGVTRAYERMQCTALAFPSLSLSLNVCAQIHVNTISSNEIEITNEQTMLRVCTQCSGGGTE